MPSLVGSEMCIRDRWSCLHHSRHVCMQHIRSTRTFTFSSYDLLTPPFFSLPPGRNSDPGSHSRLFFPPTHYGSCLAFLSREYFSSSLVDLRRIVLTHARRSQQLALFFFFFLQIYFKISPRRDSNSRTNTSSICGLPLVSPPGRPPYTYTRYLVILHNCTAVEYL